ncbi:MAG TPA: hypothetical protein DCY06_13950 [Bacteroidetes bacterium]|nr:hypothetical protein [Bacteroidota bacterium]
MHSRWQAFLNKNMRQLILATTIFLIVIGQSFSQDSKELALSKGREAIKLMDGGQIDESIKLLEECIKLEPKNSIWPYELAYAYYLKEDYKKSIDILTRLTKQKDAQDLYFQLLGNSYDLVGQRAKSISTYENGIKKFPKSGKLHLELGNMYLHTKEYEKAVSYYEKGIDVEPGFPSNYYRLALLFLNTDNEVWGMIYGEIFMNLERNSKRTAEISKLLYDTYISEIKFTSDTSFTVSFSSNVIELNNPKKFKLPYGLGVYEPTLLMSVIGEKTIDLNSLDRIRTSFIKNYFHNNRDKEYPNVLFSYQNEMLKLGHLEAYNHWILMKGDEDSFSEWKESNNDKWDNFVDWFNPNGLKINDKNKFIRTQY